MFWWLYVHISSGILHGRETAKSSEGKTVAQKGSLREVLRCSQGGDTLSRERPGALKMFLIIPSTNHWHLNQLRFLLLKMQITASSELKWEEGDGILGSSTTLNKPTSRWFLRTPKEEPLCMPCCKEVSPDSVIYFSIQDLWNWWKCNN